MSQALDDELPTMLRDIRMVEESAELLSIETISAAELTLKLGGRQLQPPHVGWDIVADLLIAQNGVEIAHVRNAQRATLRDDVNAGDDYPQAAAIFALVWPYIRSGLGDSISRLGLPRPPLPVWVDPEQVRPVSAEGA